MSEYQEVLIEFLKEKFGPSIGSKLLDMYLTEHNLESVEDIQEMNFYEQNNFIQTFLEKVFCRFYTDEKLSQLKAEILARAMIKVINTKEPDSCLKLIEVGPEKQIEKDDSKPSFKYSITFDKSQPVGLNILPVDEKEVMSDNECENQLKLLLNALKEKLNLTSEINNQPKDKFQKKINLKLSQALKDKNIEFGVEILF